MNRIVVFFSLVLCAALVAIHIFGTAPKAFAGEPNAAAEPAASVAPTAIPPTDAEHQELMRGVWREGKAVFFRYSTPRHIYKIRSWIPS